MQSKNSELNWIVVGADGMLGCDLVDKLENRNVIALTKSDCDITNLDSINSSVKNADVVVNCAAYTKVDQAESEETIANEVNGYGVKNLALVCRDIGAKLIQISTDYVFSGEAKVPYSEKSDCNPKSKYGKSKLLGEVYAREILPNNSYIVRTAWLYGQNGANFGKTILHLSKTSQDINVVDDQFGQPTWTVDLANKIIELVEVNAPSGTYHGTSSGQTSWFNFAQRIFEFSGLDPNRIKPAKTSDFPRPAQRPSFSVLGHENFEMANVDPIRNWESALREAVTLGVFDV